MELKREIEHHEDSRHARAIAYDVNQRIIKDDEALPHFIRASQNVAAAAALFQGLPEPTTPEDRRAHCEICALLERAAAQQAESSLSQRHEVDASKRAPLDQPDRDVSVHQA